MKKTRTIPAAAFVFLLLWAAAQNSYAQLLPLNPPIRNYTPKEYAAHSQVWAAVSDHRGVLYFGIGGNVLEYDGKTWRLIPVKPGATVTSLATDSTGRIYVGTAGDFGYIGCRDKALPCLYDDPDTLPNGTLRYVSLLHLVPEKERNFGQVWKTHSCRQGTFFNAYSHLFYYDGKKIRVIKPEELMRASDTAGTKPQNRRFFSSFLIDDTLYIEHRVMGILAYLEKEWSPPLAGSKEFVTGTKGIYSLLPASKQKSEFFVVTQYDGLWHYNASAKPEFTQFISGTQSGVQRGGKIINNNWDMYEPQCQPYGATLLKTMGDDTITNVSIAINTLYNGCYIFSPLVTYNGTGNSLALQHHFDRESGTLDNSILNILSTDNDRWSRNASLLWLCNDNGISKVTYPSPLSYYGYKEGIEGSIQSIITWKNRIWLATAQGVYYSLNPEIPQERMKTDKGVYFERLPGIDALCFNILTYLKAAGVVKGEMEEVLIIAAYNLGLYEVSVTTGGEIKAKQICKDQSYGLTAEDIPGGRIFSGADGLYVATQTKAGWTTTTLLTEKEVKGISSITLSEKKTTLGENGEEETELWLGTRYQGLLRVAVTADNKVTEKEWYGEEDGLPEGNIQTFSCTGAAISNRQSTIGNRQSEINSNGVLVGTDKGLFEVVSVVSRKLKVVSGKGEDGSRESEVGSGETEVGSGKPGDGSQEHAKNEADEQINSGGTQITNQKSPIKNYEIVPCTRYGEMFAGKLKSDSGSYRYVFRFVEEENGDVWITGDREYHLRKTNDNIYKIDSIPFLNIREKIGATYAIHPSGEGITFFGGTEGLAMYDAKVKKNYKPVYSALVRKVLVGEDSVVYNGADFSPLLSGEGLGVRFLPYDLNNIKFEYAAPFFEEEEKTVYSYKLEGFDEEWSAWSTDAKTKYTNLEPGEYRFLIKAKNLYAHESEVGEYVFEIEPPFHRTWWFYSLQAGILIILGFVAVYYARTRNGKAAKFAISLGTVVVFLVFEYCQNYVEIYLEDYLGGVVILKVILNILTFALLIPFKMFMEYLLMVRQKMSYNKESARARLDAIERVAQKGEAMKLKMKIEKEKEKWKQEGREENRNEFIKRMKEKGYSDDDIKSVT